MTQIGNKSAGKGDQSFKTLTTRERECLLWAALGKRTKHIAAILGISQATTNEYISSAMNKLDASTRAQAVAILMRAGDKLGES